MTSPEPLPLEGSTPPCINPRCLSQNHPGSAFLSFKWVFTMRPAVTAASRGGWGGSLFPSGHCSPFSFHAQDRKRRRGNGEGKRVWSWNLGEGEDQRKKGAGFGTPPLAFSGLSSTLPTHSGKERKGLVLENVGYLTKQND